LIWGVQLYFVREARIVAEWTPKHLLLLNGEPPERNGSTVHNYPYGELLICDRSIQSGSFSESKIHTGQAVQADSAVSDTTESEAGQSVRFHQGMDGSFRTDNELMQPEPAGHIILK